MDARHQEIARCLFRESNDALFIFDPSDHAVVDVNPAALRLTGFDKDVLCAKRLRDLFTSSEPAGLGNLVAAYRRTGYYHSREGYYLGRADGEPIPVNVSVSRIHTTPDPLGLVVARDISERIRAQEALRESESRYRGLVESARLLIFGVSEGGLIVSLNTAFEAETGRARTSWIGRPFADLVHPDDRAAAFEAFRKTLRGESLPPYELRIMPEEGEPLVIEVLSASPYSQGDEVSVSAIARNVTSRKKVEEALQRTEAMRRAKESAEAADRAKSEFLGHISHEIRTPMTVILGFTDLVLDDPRVRALPPALLEHFGTIKENGNHLLDLINDILDLTRIEVGKLRIERSPCSPAQLLENVAASMRPRAEAKGLSLTLEVSPRVPKTISTDAVRLRQILINLLSNAIKYTENGHVRVDLQLVPEEGEDPTIRFAVSDTGVGLSENELGQLFELFYTSDKRHTRESGAGLGLAISRRLAEMLDGRITVQSRRGVGSVFTLILPIREPVAEGPKIPAESTDGATVDAEPSTPVPTLGGGRVLLAEDNESIRRYIALRLEQSGAEVITARNGQEAVEAALAARDEGRPYDWILMDVQMPILDGNEATLHLRHDGYRGPIIALTAYAIPEHRDDCLRFGCDDHVSKPVDWDRLIEVLLLHRRSAPDEPARAGTPAATSPTS
jgi:PAS domain S-box-containing protein